jgi:hypothetical protein
MKKLVIALILASVFYNIQLMGQQKPFVFGFKAGPTMGWLKPDARGYDSEGLKAGFSWGFIADFFLMENYGIATGFDVVFLNGGLKMPASISEDGETLEGTLRRDYKLKYLQIPVTLKMRTREMGIFRIFGQIGLGTNFLLGAKADDNFTPDSGTLRSEEVDIYDDITFIRESLIIGAGVEISLGGSTRLITDVIFNNGFMDILKGMNSSDPTINNKAIANYLALEVGIVF